MLRHKGEKRTHRHNIRLAALLCLTAGLVNISGLRGFHELTTNVTGHAAFFAGNLVDGAYGAAFTSAAWILMFLLGAFASGVYIKAVGDNARNAYTVPILTEMLILATTGWQGARCQCRQ